MKTLQEILIATGNPAKFREMAAVLSETDSQVPEIAVSWRSLQDLARCIPEPVEHGTTMRENAALKARYYSAATGLWVLSDDSGLEVDALDGAPGVFSARFAGNHAGADRAAADRANNAKLVAALRGVPRDRRTARFRCCLALASGDKLLAEAEGVIEGIIIDEPRGAGGFGYDPHFWVPRLEKTTAELPPEDKNRISHRGQALRRMRTLIAECLSEPDKASV